MNEKKKKLIRILTITPLVIVGAAIFIFIGGAIVLVLWNWLLPSLFGFPQINFWQALGILLLCRILFGGFGMKGGGSESRRRASDRIADRVAERISQKLENMTPEERERFRQRARERWAGEPPTRETTEL